jgi:predicted transcriptional regulator
VYMPDSAAVHHGESVTFRIDPALKAELARVAEQDRKSLGELLRELVRDRVAQERRRAFEAEARRQSLLIAERARDPNSDEAEVTRWIAEVTDPEGWGA